MDEGSAVTILGGIGLFLLGIHHLTEGLKDLAGDSLRRALQRLVSGKISAVASGVVFTALSQSSTATILTVIGFVSAGLLSSAQAIGVIMGATLGTTTTPWMVALLGFRVSVSSAALPILGVGAFLWLVAKGKWRSLGAVLAGFGLIFTGIDFLQAGMENVTWNFENFTGPGSLWILAGVGIVMTIIMQSSSAAAATTLVAVHAGSLTFDQACAMIVGQSIGTTATSALTMIGAGVSVRQAALAHVLFSFVVGILGMLFLAPLANFSEWVILKFGEPDKVMSLAAFTSLFKLAGVVVFLPFIEPFSKLIVRIAGTGDQSAVGRLDPTLADAGGAVAIEAAWRATLEISRETIDAFRQQLAGNAKKYQPSTNAVQQVESFLESLSLETTDLSTIGPRLIKLCHSLDHLTQLQEDFAKMPTDRSTIVASSSSVIPPLDLWLSSTTDPNSLPDERVIAAIGEVSKEMELQQKSHREKTLEDIALQRLSASSGRAGLDANAWLVTSLSHIWRLTDSLRLAAGEDISPPLERRELVYGHPQLQTQ